MQSPASQRVLSTLASKLHPQLPLSPRESQQLLNLLTTSFRAHLDREHPTSQSRRVQKRTGSHAPRSPSPSRAPTSYASATRHIDSILTNPLFAVKPQRRASDPAAVDVLRDPIGWFVDQIAIGAADLPKAAMCLEVLEKAPEQTTLYNGKSRAFVLAEWLRSSGLDQSREFVDVHMARNSLGDKFIERLVVLMFAEGETAAPWRWFIRSPEQRVQETSLDAKQVAEFRHQLLWSMVSTEANKNLDRGFAVFMQAFRMAEVQALDSAFATLRPAGAHLVNRVIATPGHSVELPLYEAFLRSSPQWLGNWGQAVEAMLWLHHPTQQSTSPAMSYIRDPSGAAAYVQSTKSRRNFLVQLCLGVARQLIQEEKYKEAQVPMQFAKEHFADLVLSKAPSVASNNAASYKKREEKKNLELLDQLIPT